MRRVPGHGLLFEGAAFDQFGDRIGWWSTTGNAGHAKCECGALSEELPSGNARRRWHAEHKATLITKDNT